MRFLNERTRTGTVAVLEMVRGSRAWWSRGESFSSTMAAAQDCLQLESRQAAG
jgi:hypothetical protein